MGPYFLLLSLSGAPALAGIRQSRWLLPAILLILWLAIGFRFEVGTDWNNYLFIFQAAQLMPPATLLVGREPGFGLLMILSDVTGGGYILINVVSAAIFCWGLYRFVRTCHEPLLALTVATPLVVITLAMNLTRQAMALGIILMLYASWQRRGLVARGTMVALAATFHFSAIFVLIFVALGARATQLVRFGGAALIGLGIVGVIYAAPSAMEAYSRLYISGKVSAPGAIIHVGIIALAAFVYLINRTRFLALNHGNALYDYLAIAGLAAVPFVWYSSVGAYRFSLYLWPMAMMVWAGMPALIANAATRFIYRMAIVVAAGAVLFGWLNYANNSADWMPYNNWLLLDEPATPRVNPR
jgi:hypothetical protein